jgi:hypothetical protein
MSNDKQSKPTEQEEKDAAARKAALKTDAATLAKHGGMAETVRREFLTAMVVAGHSWTDAEEALLAGVELGHLP